MTNKVVYNDNVLIDLTADTVDAENLMTGYTAHDKSARLSKAGRLCYNNKNGF